MKRFKAFVLSVCLILSLSFSASAATHGPATSYKQLLDLAEKAQEGDVLLVSGSLSAEGYSPLSPQGYLLIQSVSGDPATLRSMQLADARISFSNIHIEDSLSITGTSHIELSDGVSVKGAPGKSGVWFDGSGSLLVYPGCVVTGGEGGDGRFLHPHQAGIRLRAERRG